MGSHSWHFPLMKLKVDTVDFETALGTKNKICIGNINDTIVICDDYKLTEYFLSENNTLDLTEGEKNISSLFTNSEILAVACYSVSDFHAYSLIKNGKKTRLKIVSQEDKHQPFNDTQLTDILALKGYPLARRTIAKYRDLLGIPSATMRRVL